MQIDTKIQDFTEGSSNRSFGMVFSVVFGILAIWPLFDGGGIRVWALTLASAFFALALIWPHSLYWPNRIWFHFGAILHKIVSPVAIGLIYYLALVPTALLTRAFGKYPLSLKYDVNAKSYWIARKPPGPDPKSMNDQF